jgi:hypothetical protein
VAVIYDHVVHAEVLVCGELSCRSRGRTGIPVTIIYKTDQTGALHPSGAYAVNGGVYDEIVTLLGKSSISGSLRAS